jgi:hypothetical protein
MKIEGASAYLEEGNGMSGDDEANPKYPGRPDFCDYSGRETTISWKKLT